MSHDSMISWATAVALMVVCASAVPFHRGWLVPSVSLVVCAGVGVVIIRLLERPSSGMPPIGRRTLAGLWILVGAVLTALLARLIGAVAIAFPAAVWSLVALVLSGWIFGRASWLLRWLVVPAVVVACIAGTRFEAAAVDARGWAHSGPVLGIHPFQSTSVSIDGFGPFDLPFNDFIEVDSGRGYGPDEAAEVLERALHKMADVHFADGPQRARQAFAGARVEVVRTQPVSERLDRTPSETEHVRFVVHSGTLGQRSRVAFVCPGRRLDPRGMLPDQVIEQMCPDKYTSEASAGLGLTGRWTGYVEARGNERFGLGSSLGWTRSDDPLGRRHTLREQWGWAWLALAISLGCGLMRRATPVMAVAGRMTACTIVVALILAFQSLLAGTVPVSAWVNPVWPSVFNHLPLAAALAVVALHGPSKSGGRAPVSGLAVALVWIAALTIWASQHLAATTWLVPELWYHRGPGIGHGDWALACERWVLEVADLFPGLQAIAQDMLGSEDSDAGMGLAMCQNLVASALITLFFGALVGIVRGVGLWCRRLNPIPRLSRVVTGRLGAISMIAIAGGLVMSRQTSGASSLLEFAVYAAGLCIVAVAGYRLDGRVGRVLIRLLGAVLGCLAIASLARAGRGASHSGVFLHTTLIVCCSAVIAAWVFNLVGGRVSSAVATDKQHRDT